MAMYQSSYTGAQIDAAVGAAIFPVDIDSLTPSSTFVKNNILAINGVFYRATANTSNFPVTLATQGNAFVVNVVDGLICFVVTDNTLNSDWEVWTDASIDYWLHQYDASLQALNTQVGTLEPKVSIVSVASGTTSISAQANKYYRVAGSVGTLTITLPSVTDNTTVSSIMVMMTTGSTPNVTVTASGGATVSYYADYAIEASKSYELSFLWNGSKWIVAYGVIS